MQARMMVNFPKTLFIVTLLGLCAGLAPADAQSKGKARLFILSGQSNMVGLNPSLSFTPELNKAYPNDDIIVIKDAAGGQPIRRWLKEWQAPPGAKLKGNVPLGDLYEKLMKQVEKATRDKKIDTIVFVWMQGERDAGEGNAPVYEANLLALIGQLRKDLKRQDIHVVIGRLSDCRKGQAQWDAIRSIQAKVGASDSRFGWVDTDDLNGPKDDLHYTKAGYVELGRRFAAKAIELLKADKQGRDDK